MTDLLRSVVTVIDIFYKYTKQDGECGTLSKDELKELLEKEFRPILKNPDDPDTVDVIMHMLDRDHDRRLDFTEFLLMVFKLAMACNKVLSRKYCKASGSKKRRHGHQHQKEESETEEEEEETPRQKSGYRHSSWREGEEHGYASGGSRGTEKHSRGSNSRRLERQGEFSSSEGSETSHHGSSSGHSWSSGKERHGSSSEGLRERRNKSHGGPSRKSGEEHESGARSKSQGRKGHGGMSHGLGTNGHEPNSTQTRKNGNQKHGSTSAGLGENKGQGHACGYSNSGGCRGSQNASSSCQPSRSGDQGNQSSYNHSGCQSGSSGGQGNGCFSGGHPSECPQSEPRSCSHSSSQKGHGYRQCGQPQNCGRQQGMSSSQSSCHGQHGSGRSQSCCGQHGSGSSQSTSYGQCGSSSGQSSGYRQHGSGTGHSCYEQHGSGSSQSTGYVQCGSSSGQSSSFGQQGCSSGNSTSSGQHNSGQSSGSGKHGTSQSSGPVQHSSGQLSGSAHHGSGQSSGPVQHRSGQSSGIGQHCSGQSRGFGPHGSGQSSGSGHTSSQSSGVVQHGSGQSAGCGQHGLGQYSGSGQHRSGQTSGRGTVSPRRAFGSHQTHSHNTHGYSRDSIRKHSAFPRLRNNDKKKYVSSQRWRHGSYGSAGYDYGQSGYGPSETSRTISHDSSPQRSADRAIHREVSRHGQSFSSSEHVSSNTSEGTREPFSFHGQAAIPHCPLLDSYSQSASSITRNQSSSHDHSILHAEQSSFPDVQSEYIRTRKQSSAHSQSNSDSDPTHRESMTFYGHSVEPSSIRTQSGFSINERQVHSHSPSRSSDELSIDSRNRNQRSISSYSLHSQEPMETEEYRYNYLPSTVTWDEQSQGQDLGSHPSESISKYSQQIAANQPRISQARGYHQSRRMDSNCFSVDSNTPLYEYFQEQRCYHFK